MPGCLDAEGLEWIGGGDGGDAIIGVGIGRNPHTLKLQELGGFLDGICDFMYWLTIILLYSIWTGFQVVRE